MLVLGAQGNGKDTLINLTKEIASTVDWRNLPKEKQDEPIHDHNGRKGCGRGNANSKCNVEQLL